MSFKDEYTTADLELSKSSLILDLDRIDEPVASKIVLSNDAYAIGLLLESLINTRMR